MPAAPRSPRFLVRLARRLFAPESAQLAALRHEVAELRTLTERLGGKLNDIASAQKQVGKVLANQKADERARQTLRL